MLGSLFGQRRILALLAAASLYGQSLSPTANLAPATVVSKWSPIPESETLQYSVDWRLIPAGTAVIAMKQNPPGSNHGYSTDVRLTSLGLLDKLFKVQDSYHADYEGPFCAVQSTLDAAEGKRHRETKIAFDRTRRKASSVERDMIGGGKVVKSSEVEIPACVQDLVGALFILRTMHLEPGQSSTIPMSDGKKSVNAKVEAQEWEQVKTKAGTFKTLRYEAYIFNSVLYARNARLTLWISDDERRLPVQMRIKMQFTIGTVTLSLDKIGEEPVKRAD